MLRPGTFVLDALPGTFPGFTDGARWNGWATPLFPRAVALRIAEALRTAPSGADPSAALRYDAAADAFVLHDPFAPDESTAFPAVSPPGAPEPLYPIGAHLWTWEEPHAPAPTPSPETTYQTLHLLYEAGPDPLTGEPLPEERETLTLVAPTPEAAARLSMRHARIPAHGRLVRFFAIDGREVFAF